MAFAAAARRSLGSRISGHLHPALPHLLTFPDSSGDPRDHSPPRPPPRLQPPHLPLLESSRTAKTLPPLLPFGIHLAAPPRRGFSSSSGPAFDVSTIVSDAADAVTPATSAAVSFPSEVALAAEGCSLSTAAVQHLIDAVHSSTGLNWGISIALSTVLLRCLLFPMSLMAIRGFVGMKKEILAVQELVKSANDEKSINEAIRGQIYVYKRLGLPSFVLILTPYTFMTLYFAISHMVEEVPPLKEGGAFWFTDLTTPDALHIFPVLTSLFLMLRLEFILHYAKAPMLNEVRTGMQVVRTLILLTVPLTASLPQAFSCYFVTWSFTSLVHRIVIQQPAVKKLLFGDLIKPTYPKSDGSKGPAGEDSPRPSERPEQ